VELDDASRVTKIGRNYLVAIEEEQFEKLPNAAYIKGFLRLYAGFLSLSGDEVVARYERSLPAAVRPQVETQPERPGIEIMERAKLGGVGRWVIPTLLLGLVILAALFLSNGEEKQLRPSAPRPVTPAAAPTPAAVVQPQHSSATTPVQGAAPVAVEPLPALPAGVKRPGGIILRLRFNQDSWLSITIDDSISQRYDLKAGDIIEWKGAQQFVLDVGDGGAVEAEFNGRPLKTLGEPGKIAHVVLKGE
jgi:cytoskeletal protein RodZ